MFKAILIDKVDDKQKVSFEQLEASSLPAGEVEVDVSYSTLNYKDALALTGAAPVVRRFPMVPGIDCVGRVVKSASPEFKEGDCVVLNGWGAGETQWGGLSERATLSAAHLISLPSSISMKQSMAIGTAGYTAMLCVMALENHGLTPDMGEILVTGAAGGVGSVAIALLSAKGFDVAAATGRVEEEAYLRKLGAKNIVHREELSGKPRALAQEKWAGAIDVAGSQVLANVLSQIKYGGAVAACGLAAGMDLPSSVAPFILRGVSLLGVDSVMCSKEKRIKAWDELAQHLDMGLLEEITHEVAFEEVLEIAPKFLQGQVKGRLVVAINPED